MKKRSSSKTIIVEGVGKIHLHRSRRAKHVCLSVRPFKGVSVAVPYNVSFKEAVKVAQSKSDWLTKHMQRVSQIEEAADAFNRQAPINRAVARRIIVERLEELAHQNGFAYNKVFVRNQKTRWGSCSNHNNINLNVNLIRLPAQLMDYIILHELTHTRIKNHSPQFWEELAKYIPHPKEVDKQLKPYGPMLLSNE